VRGSIIAVVLLAGAGCGPPPEDPTERSAADLETARAAAYRDVEETFTTEEDQNRWFELKRGLQRDFDDICGDTFCEGDFTNLASMSFRCSVSVRSGVIKSCLWLFAGSYETVTPSTGNVRPVAKFFPCAIPLQGSPGAVMDALLAPGGRGPLWSPMPGGTQSIYDVLGSCL
jgi:hypothetical protein